MEKQSRVFISELAFKEHMKGAQYIFAYLNRKFPEDIEYLSITEHNAITKLTSETIEHWKSKAEGWQKDAAKLEAKLESAKEALREIEKDQWILLRVDLDKIKAIARKCLKKLEGE